MKTETRTEAGYKKIISFEIEKDELDGFRKKAFDKFRKTAKIDGFRPGKVPESIVKTKFAASIEAEAVNEAINDTYREYLISNNLYPLSEPLIENIDKKEDVLKFTAAVETYPEFELRPYSGMVVEQEKSEVTEKHKIDALKDLLEQFATKKETDSPVSKGHVVDISIRPAGKDDAKWEPQSVEIGRNPDEKLDEQFIGMKKGEIKTVSLDPSGKEDKNYMFDVRIDNVSEKILPELNDEFAKTYDAKFNSAEELKNDIAERLERGRRIEEENRIYDKLAKKITEAHDNFEVPPTILSKYLDDLTLNAQKQYGKSVSRDMLKNIYAENAKNSLKWEYLRHAITEKEALEVTEEDIENRMKEIAEEGRIDIEKVKSYYSKKEKKQMMKDDLLDKKLRKLLKEKNTVNFVDAAQEAETK
jgi:trigger factor